MRTFIGLTKRNMLVYLKNKATVFFSLLTPLIILMLYILFLKQNYVDNLNNALKGFNDLVTDKQIDSLVNSWLIAGLVASSFITVPLSSLEVMVSDFEKNKDFDFSSTPIKKWVIGLSYLVASFLNTLIITAIILTIGIITIQSGEAKLNALDILLAYIGLIFGSLSGAAFMFLIMIFFKKSSTVGAFTGIVCAASGFLIGAYMPISMFSKPIQVVANMLPGSHAAAIYRNLLVNGSIEAINSKINSPAFLDAMEDIFSINLNFFGNDIGTNVMWVYLILSTFVIIGINSLLYLKLSKRK